MPVWRAFTAWDGQSRSFIDFECWWSRKGYSSVRCPSATITVGSVFAMSKKRVYELAKELGLENKELIFRLEKIGITVRSHSSTLDDSDLEKIQLELHSPDPTRVGRTANQVHSDQTKGGPSRLPKRRPSHPRRSPLPRHLSPTRGSHPEGRSPGAALPKKFPCGPRSTGIDPLSKLCPNR